jgi:peptidoglycan/xylan/chitin deacetylase (PgdA/CDA1 family)
MFGRGKILAFHQIADRFYPGINNIRPYKFWAILDLLESWGFTFWNGENPAGDKTSSNVILTFDDGYADQYDLLVELRRREIMPFVFIPAGFIGRENHWEYSSRLFGARHLDRNQLRKLAEAGVIIGSHGLTHQSLPGMNEENLHRELSESMRILKDILEREVGLISFPFGRIDNRVINAARQCGYGHGFALDHQLLDDRSKDFIRPRIPVYGIDDFYSLRAKLVKRSRLEGIKSRIINDLAGGTIIVSNRTQIKRNSSENS